MTKNIIIAVLAVLLLLSFVYGSSQKTETENQRELAVASQFEAEKQRDAAVEQMALAVQAKQIADANAMEALKQSQFTQEALKHCKGTK